MKKILFLVIMTILSISAFSQKKKVTKSQSSSVEIHYPVYKLGGPIMADSLIKVRLLESNVVVQVSNCVWAKKGEIVMVEGYHYTKYTYREKSTRYCVSFCIAPWRPAIGYDTDYTFIDETDNPEIKRVVLVRKAVVL